MMQSNRELAAKIVDKVLSLHSSRDKEALVDDIENQISWAMDDALRLIKNINETSTNSFDRTNRLIEAEVKYGIPKTHLL